MDPSLHNIVPGFATAAILLYVLWSVASNNKSLASWIQLGELQRRAEVHGESLQRRQEPPPHTKHNSVASRTLEALSSAGRKSFTLGVINLALTCYIIGSAPGYYYLWYSPKAVILISLRWLDFKRKKTHFLLADFCYWANLLALVYVWFTPTSHTAFQILFLCANGPLAWAVLAFNQSLVFHKWQQVVSVFIHVSPMLLTYGIRWHTPAGFSVCFDPPNCASVSAVTLLWNAMTRFYLFWVVGYYCAIFVLLGPYLESRSFKTLYDRVAGAQMKMLFGEGAVFSRYHDLIKNP